MGPTCQMSWSYGFKPRILRATNKMTDDANNCYVDYSRYPTIGRNNRKYTGIVLHISPHHSATHTHTHTRPCN